MTPNLAPLFGAHFLVEMQTVSMVFCAELFVILGNIKLFLMGNRFITNALEDSCIKILSL